VNNGKKNQPLKLLIGKTIGNKGVVLKAQGGAGKGKLKIIKSSYRGRPPMQTSNTGSVPGQVWRCIWQLHPEREETPGQDLQRGESPPLVLKVNR
jgi:hypothetical protein